MPECQNCGERMSHNDETTKLTEYVCARCHRTEIVRKDAYRVTAEGPAAAAAVADDD
jgi:ribosomal protein S27AE